MKHSVPLWVELKETNIFQGLMDKSFLLFLLYDPHFSNLPATKVKQPLYLKDLTDHKSQTALSIFKTLAQHYQGMDVFFAILLHKEPAYMATTLVGDYNKNELPLFAVASTTHKTKAVGAVVKGLG